jgi:6-phosphofructokinase 1
MVASVGGGTRAVPIDRVAGNLKTVPLDHSWIHAARNVGTNLGD